MVEELMSKRAQGGFTLVEVVVALIVVAIGIIGLSIVFPLATRDVGKSGVMSKAVELCQEKIEDFHMTGYDAIDLDPGYTHADTLNPIGGVYTRTWETYGDVPMPGCKRVVVRVTWNTYDQDSVKLWTIIASAGR
jgi:prepilin-type N-terminal cleavage/methylation domain-containing protein